MTKAVEDVNQHSSAEIDALKENQMILGELQVLLNVSFHCTYKYSPVFINFIKTDWALRNGPI